MRKPRKPGRSADHKGRSKGRDPFVLLTKFMLASPAWQSLIAVERALLIEVMQRWSGFNNGSIGLGVLEAGRALHVKPQTIGFAFRELVKRGFLEKMRDSTFDQKKLTREWRVTCLVMGPSNAPTAPPTHDYMRWRPSPDDTRERPARKKKPVPFGDKLSAVSGQDLAQLEQRNAPTVSPNGTMVDALSAVRGQPSISGEEKATRTAGDAGAERGKDPPRSRARSRSADG